MHLPIMDIESKCFEDTNVWKHFCLDYSSRFHEAALGSDFTLLLDACPSFLLCVCDKTPQLKATFGEKKKKKGCVVYNPKSQSTLEGTQGRNLTAAQLACHSTQHYLIPSP